MNEKEIADLEHIVNRLERLFERYQENDYKSQYDKLKKDRASASNKMFAYGKSIEKELKSAYVYSIINDGRLDPQFEDFYKYVNSDTPGHVERIKQYIKTLKENENSL